ncbi:sigma-70 family RNA polymerase sigma factor [Corynebacterium poyangense]|uniref:Sigma-70 family RNA polymerase sigma factor n=1 Tax=Corynebacterium poyangense TaxID=2684405 RepID=A0A7H0SRZ8_9CORY|nr:sigma-70 family RNA polymerase sigma factor [Corynebacterium poyangense]MBZ8177269.1 sigma-70 family RNA polymerase sigma factor [Corynebacterium poyangense]QNQ91323.1 sigma-70 family RNA polymerase sigma factor [Corynebacterium poyangense]
MSSYSHKPDDFELVRAYNSGDREAFKLIVKRHNQRLMAVARRYARNEHDAKDILQEALFKASRHLHNFRFEAAVSTWLHRLVLNSGHDYVTNSQRRELSNLDDTDDPSRTLPAALTYDPFRHLDTTLTLFAAMKQLRPDQCYALLLVDLYGLDIASAARIAKVRPGTMKSRRGRARAHLREILEGSW